MAGLAVLEHVKIPALDETSIGITEVALPGKPATLSALQILAVDSSLRSTEPAELIAPRMQEGDKQDHDLPKRTPSKDGGGIEKSIEKDKGDGKGDEKETK